MNILFGLIRPDAGRVIIDGHRVSIRSPQIAQSLGIGMVHQHFKLSPQLTVLENMAMAVNNNLGLLRRTTLRKRICELMERLHWSIDPDVRVASLNVGQQQRVEIIKALCGGGKILILDEPTAVLTPQEVDHLIAAMRALAANGVTILFISHKLTEVNRVCDTISVLRRGHVVFSGRAGELTSEQIAERMIGTHPQLPPVLASRSPPGLPRLVLNGVSCLSHGPGQIRSLIENIDLRVHAGEIVGVAGVEGNGQTVLIECILGRRSIQEGTVTLDGQSLDRLPGYRRTRQFACIPEDRQKEGLVLSLTLTANLMLRDFRRPGFSAFGLNQTSHWRRHAAAMVEQFDIRAESLESTVGSLSGGNQQKTAIARELSSNPRMILAINPTRGLDIGATAFVLHQLAAAREHGAAVLLVHSDLDELLLLSDRVMVMYAGRLLPTAWPTTTRETIGRLMLGAGTVTKSGFTPNHETEPFGV